MEDERGAYWLYNDGGRAAAGYKGKTGDCAVRAAAIVTGRPYQDVYDAINAYAKNERVGKRKRSVSDARLGVYRRTLGKFMFDCGFKWVATMGIGTGCTVHLHPNELPDATILCRVSKHYVAVVNGIINDTYDSGYDGKRCVYGYWKRD